jgi:hypothetical protein
VNVNSSGGFGDADPQPPQTFTHNTGDLISWSEPNFLYSPAGGDGDGTYWQSMTVTSPNSMTSNQATITDAC